MVLEKTNASKKAGNTKVSRRALYKANLNFINEKNSTRTSLHTRCRTGFRRSLRERGEQCRVYRADYTGAVTDFHVGYEGGTDTFGFYVQGGPAVVTVDGADESDNRISGKVGATVAATEKLDLYGEVSVLTANSDTDDDNAWATKVGAKFSF